MKCKKMLAILMAVTLTVCSFCTLASAEADGGIKSYKNVILMIGDGMGYFHLELTKQELGIDLFMDTYDVKGYSQTRSHNDEVTDSAAGATALACATRTNNGFVGVYPNDKYALFSFPKSITEVAIENGKSTGVVTSDSTAGATPSGFSAHVEERGASKKISKQQVNSDIDLIWGAACKDVDTAKAAENGFTVVTTAAEMNALESGTRSFGQFSGTTWKSVAPEGDTSPRLSQMTEKAIDLLDDDEDGFFLMVEGAHIDKQSHSQNVEGAVDALAEFDRAVEIAATYAETKGDTLVIVTADHETGGITYGIDGKFAFTQGSHSATNVPILVFGGGDSNFITPEETIKNTDIPLRIADALDFETNEFPFKADGVVTAFFKDLLSKFLSIFTGDALYEIGR